MDEWPADGSLNLLSAAAELTCTTPGEGDPVAFDVDADPLEPGVPVTCDFSIPNYITGAGASITNTVTLDTDKTEPVSDTSTVTTPRASGCVTNCGGSNPSYSIIVETLNNENGIGGFNDDGTEDAAG